jgi:hypothetical protein
MFSIFKNKKKSKAFVALVFTFFVLISFVPQQADAGLWSCLLDGAASATNPIWLVFGSHTNCMNNIMATIFYAILTLCSWVLGLVGLVFNSVFEITVVHMTENVAGIKIISVGWAAVRDMANILFIFMLLYLAISTILQLDEHGVKHGLSRLIIGAVLINFSLFFVKIPIDVSNMLATEIYNKIQPAGGNTNANGGSSTSFGLGDAFMQMFSLQKAFKDPGLATLDANTINADKAQPSLVKNPVTTFFMGIILMFITVFIFLAVIIIFVKRFITLVMLMIFSPLAFAGMAIPSHDVEHQISHDFWNTLIKESFYAPVFMFLMYLTFSLGKALDGATMVGQPELEFLGMLPVGNIISYTVVMGMLIFSLTVSEKVGVKGASSAIGGFNAMRGATAGWIGTNTISRAASTFINSKGDGASIGDNLRSWAAGTKGNSALSRYAFTAVGRAGVSALDKAGKPFDEKAEASRHWMEQAIENKHGDHAESAKIFAMAAGNNAFGTDRKAADNQFHHMSADQKANMRKHLEEMSNSGTDAEKAAAKRALERYYEHGGHGRMAADEVAEVDRIGREKLLTYDRNKIKHDLFDHNGNVITERDIVNGGDKLSQGAIDRFTNFSDKQRAEFVSSLTQKEQEALAGSAEFKKMMQSNLGDFESVQRVASANGITRKLRQSVSDVAYEARLRYVIYETLTKSTDPAKQAQIIDKMRSAGIVIPPGATKDDALKIYMADERFKGDETFKNAKENMSRFLISNDHYTQEMKALEALA